MTATLIHLKPYEVAERLRAGGAVLVDNREPDEFAHRHVANGFVLVAVVSGCLVHPGFFGLAAFMGAGLVYAGVNGTCGLARILTITPWNRPARA